MVYKQHSYNRLVHTSIGKSPFKTCFGYFPSSPLDIAYGKQEVMEDHTKYALKGNKKVKKIYLQAQETLNKSHEKYNTTPD